MDIKPLPDLLIPSARTEANDLLTYLQRAGSIEAEVLRQLPTQLLLATRLGQFETRNRVDLKPGDRVKVTFDASAEEPVLRAAKLAPTQVLRLPVSRYPELERILPDNFPRIAKIETPPGQQPRLRLAQAILPLPRELRVLPSQWLSIRSTRPEPVIEIASLSRPRLLRALVQSLVTRQLGQTAPGIPTPPQPARPAPTAATDRPTPGASDRKPAATVVRADARTTLQPQVIDPQTPVQGTREQPGTVPTAPSAPGDTRIVAATAQKPLPDRDAVRAKPEGGAQPSIGPATSRPAPQATSDRNFSAPVEPAPRVVTAEPTQVQATRPTAGDSAPNPRVAATSQSPNSATSTTPGSAPTAQPTAKVTTAPTPATQLPPAADAPQPTMTGQIPAASRSRADDVSPQSTPPGSTRTAPTSSAKAEPAGSAQVATAGSTPAVPTSSTQSAPAGTARAAATTDSAPAPAQRQIWQPLEALLPRLQTFDARTLVRWFEIFGFLRSAAAPTQAESAPTLQQILRPLGENPLPSRETLPTLQSAAQASEPAQSDKSAVGTEPLPAREISRLVEQALASNFLQRASLGLQIENQQPLSLHFHLPFIVQDAVQTLYIELQQRGGSAEQPEASWEVRLQFELAALGAIGCHVMLRGDTVTASFYCEREETRQQIEDALPELRQQLVQAGFVPGDFHSFPGKPVWEPQAATSDLVDSLIDVEV